MIAMDDGDTKFIAAFDAVVAVSQSLHLRHWAVVNAQTFRTGDHRTR
jgi:hypothetical protein